MTISRAAALALLAACARAPAPAPLHNEAAAADPRGPIAPRCPAPAPARVDLASPALGGVAGTVIDEQCERVAGATIFVRARTLGGRSSITDEDGRFAVPDLAPGRYVISVFYLDSKLERGGVQIRAGALEHVQLTMPPPVKAAARITHDLPTP